MVKKVLQVVLCGLFIISLVGCDDRSSYYIGPETVEDFNKGRIQIVAMSSYSIFDAETEEYISDIDRYAFNEPNLLVYVPSEKLYYIIDTTTGEVQTQSEIDESQYRFHKLELTSSMIDYRKWIENTP